MSTTHNNHSTTHNNHSTTHNHQTTTAQNNYNKGGKKAYFYLTQWAIYARNYYIDDIPSEVTDIVYAFWQPTTDGNGNGMIQTLDNTADNVFTFPQKTDWKDGSVIASPSNYPNPAGTFSLLEQLYENRGGEINIKLAIGGWTMSQNWSDVVKNSSSIITSIVSTLKTYTFFNGVSIDWEYLSDDNMNYGQPGNSVSSSDSKNCITFFKALRNALNSINPTYTIALCCLAAPEKCKFDAYEICRIIDELHVMTYDLNDGAWGNGNQIGHHTNLYSSDLCCWSVDEAVQYFIKKNVPSSKIYIGIAGYSRGYNSVPSTITNPFTTPTPPGGYNGGNTLSASYDYATSEPNQDPSFYSPGGKYYGAAETGLLPYNELLYLSYKNNIAIQLDQKTKGAYLSIPNGDSPPTYNLYTFDSPDSIKEKCKYVNTNNLGGVLMWDITGDIRGSGRANNCSYAPDISTYANVSTASDTTYSTNPLSAPIIYRCKYTNPTFYPCNYVAPNPLVPWEGIVSRTCMRYSDKTLGQNGTSSLENDPRSLIYAIINNLNPTTTTTTTNSTVFSSDTACLPATSTDFHYLEVGGQYEITSANGYDFSAYGGQALPDNNNPIVKMATSVVLGKWYKFIDNITPPFSDGSVLSYYNDICGFPFQPKVGYMFVALENSPTANGGGISISNDMLNIIVSGMNVNVVNVGDVDWETLGFLNPTVNPIINVYDPTIEFGEYYKVINKGIMYGYNNTISDTNWSVYSNTANPNVGDIVMMIADDSNVEYTNVPVYNVNDFAANGSQYYNKAIIIVSMGTSNTYNWLGYTIQANYIAVGTVVLLMGNFMATSLNGTGATFQIVQNYYLTVGLNILPTTIDKIDWSAYNDGVAVNSGDIWLYLLG